MSQLDLKPMDSAPKGAPLAELLRPQRLEDVVGQDKLIGPDGRLRRMLDSGELASIIFWGPPGTGKTTIARLLADAAGMVFEPVSAVFDGVADLRKILPAPQTARRPVGAPCYLSMKCIVSTRHSRTGCCRGSRTAPSRW